MTLPAALEPAQTERFALVPARAVRAYGWAITAVFALTGPLSLRWPGLGDARNFQTVLHPLLFVGLGFGMWAARLDDVALSRALKRAFFAAAALWLTWAQLSRYARFEINGVDFSIFDWMLYSTGHGRFGYSPIYEVDHFGVHASWILLLLVPVHRVLETPLLLTVLTPLLLWVGAFGAWRLARHYFRGDAWPLLVTVAYLTCPWLARLQDGGFRPEVMYPVAGLWFAAGWIERRRALWGIAAAALLLSKEDAALYLVPFAIGACLFERARWREAASLIAASVIVFVADVAWLQPLLLKAYHSEQPMYVTYWGNWGGTLGEIARGMLSAPHKVAWRVVTSRWWTLLAPALMLPFLSRRALFALLPGIALLGSAQYEMMFQFSGYYPAPLLPFVLWGLCEAPRSLSRLHVPDRLARGITAAALIAFPLFFNGYMRLRPPDIERLRTIDRIAEQLRPEQGPYYVQGALFPHVPYRPQPRQLFTVEALRDGTPALVNVELGAWPLTKQQLIDAVEEARAKGRLIDFGDGFYELYPPVR